MGLHQANARISSALLQALFSAIEERTIEQMQDEHPGRYVRNGYQTKERELRTSLGPFHYRLAQLYDCLLYTSPSPRDRTRSRMPSSA